MIDANELTGCSIVYYSTMRVKANDSIPAKLTRLISASCLGIEDLSNKTVGIKCHFGEFENVSYLKPAYARTIANWVKSQGGMPFVTDCNTLYPGMRWNSIDHLRCASLNGFNLESCGCPVIIADGLRGGDEVALPTLDGSTLKKALIGRTIAETDYLITLTHAKGCHASSYGGVLKNLGMGCASRSGKMVMHSHGKPSIKEDLCIGCGRCMEGCGQGAIELVNSKATIGAQCVGCGHCVSYCSQAAIGGTVVGDNDLQLKIAEYAGAIQFSKPCFHVAIAIDITLGCDCFAGNDSAIVPNIGMFASYDPVALDAAITDLINQQAPLGNGPLPELLKELDGDTDNLHAINSSSDWSLCIEHAEEIGLGKKAYKLIEVA